MRRLLLLFLLSAMAHAEQRFQVATIKPSPPGTERRTMIWGNKFVTTGTTIDDLLIYAYSIHTSQIIDAPAWFQSDKFDLVADPETEKRPTSDENKAMVRLLLADRLHLVLRREKRDLPVFAIQRTGSDLKLANDDKTPEGLVSGGFSPPGTLAVRNGTLFNLAAFIQRFATSDIDRPVVDQTGIPGRFDFDLHYTPMMASSAAPTEAATDHAPDPSIFTAMQQQLGLKLVRMKASVNVFRVESVTLPTPD